jgi:phospholipase/carboxylesterase
MPKLDGPRWGPRENGPAKQLVVLCHGVGADGHDLIDLAPTWAHALPHAAFVAPDAPEPYDQAPAGRQWFSLADRTPARIVAGVGPAGEALNAFIDEELARLGLKPGALAMMGFSQGAMTALHAALRRKVAPRAVLAYSGALIMPQGAISHPPVLLVHGEADEVVPASRSRDAEAALRAAGIAVESLFCPGLGHAIDDAGLSRGALFLQRAFADDA